MPKPLTGHAAVTAARALSCLSLSNFTRSRSSPQPTANSTPGPVIERIAARVCGARGFTLTFDPRWNAWAVCGPPPGQ